VRQDESFSPEIGLWDVGSKSFHIILVYIFIYELIIPVGINFPRDLDLDFFYDGPQ